MKFERKDFIIDAGNLYLLPSINIVFNAAELREKNFSIVFNWLMFHARIRWIKKER